MAFYDPQEDEDQQDPNAQVPGVQTQSGSSVISGMGGASGGSSAPQKTNSPDRPGNFVNLQDYLNANKSQSEKLGNQASQVINDSANAARQSVSGLNQEAQEKIKPQSYLSEDVSNRVANNAESLTPEERTQVKNTAAATYTGPQAAADLNSYQAASDATQKATQNVDNSGTEQGRMGLISQINSKPRTQGMNVFDNALLQAGTGREKLEQASLANQDVKTGLQGAADTIQNQIGRADDPSTPDIDESSGAIGQTNLARADATKKVQDALSAWTSGFQPKVTQAQQGLSDTEQRAATDVGDSPLSLSDETMGLLGLNRGESIYNLNLNDYLSNASPSDINAANVASPEDYARYGALADLSGQQDLLLDPNNLSQAGTAPTAQGNIEGLRSAIDNSKKNYEESLMRPIQGSLPSEFAPNDPLQRAYYSGANGMTPNQILNEYIPQLQALHDSSEGGADQSRAIEALQNALAQWRQNQGYTNIVSGYGVNGDLTQAPSTPGHIIYRG